MRRGLPSRKPTLAPSLVGRHRRLLVYAFLEFERDLYLRLIFTLTLGEFERLILDTRPHQIIERLFGPVDRIAHGVFETLVAPADELDFLENHPGDTLDHVRNRLTA